jgi:hypothetical protein
MSERIIVYVCYKCRKLIGTKENYYIERHHGENFTVCEGCHVNER